MKASRIFILLLLATILSFVIVGALEGKRTQDELSKLRSEFEQLNAKIDEQKESINELNQWIDKLNVGEFDLTGYATHSPDAVAGVCHDGNPDSTATGTYPTPGRTIAVDPSVIPMGSRVYISGIGLRTAEDVGGAIKGNRIDIVTASRAEAYAITRGRAAVIWERGR